MLREFFVIISCPRVKGQMFVESNRFQFEHVIMSEINVSKVLLAVAILHDIVLREEPPFGGRTRACGAYDATFRRPVVVPLFVKD